MLYPQNTHLPVEEQEYKVFLAVKKSIFPLTNVRVDERNETTDGYAEYVVWAVVSSDLRVSSCDRRVTTVL